MADTLYMETTSIDVIKTISEIEAKLLKRNVVEVRKWFKDGEVEGIIFYMEIQGKEQPFRLPMRWEAIQALARQGKTRYRKTAEETQSRKVAARLVLRWLESQLALIDTGMVEFEEVFLPYLSTDEGITYFEFFKERGLLSLASPQEENGGGE